MARKDANRAGSSQEYRPQKPTAKSTEFGTYGHDLRRPVHTAGEPNGLPPPTKICGECELDRPSCWFKGSISSTSPSRNEWNRCVSCRILRNTRQQLWYNDPRQTAANRFDAVVRSIKHQFRDWIFTLEEGTDPGIPEAPHILKEAKVLAKKVLPAKDQANERRTEGNSRGTGDGAGTHQEGMHPLEIFDTDSESGFPVNAREEDPFRRPRQMPSRSRDPEIGRVSALNPAPDAEHEQDVQQVNDASASPPLSPRQSSVARGKRPKRSADENDSQNEHENENNTDERAKRRKPQSLNYMPPSVSGAPVADETQQYSGYPTSKELFGRSNGRAPWPTPQTDTPIQGEPGSSNNQIRKTMNDVSPIRQTGASGTDLGIISPPADNGASDAFLDVDRRVEELIRVVEHLTKIQELRTWPECARERITLDVRNFTFAQADSFCAELSVYIEDVVKETQARLDAFRENMPRQVVKH